MRGAHTLRLIASRELVTRKRAFRISTGLILGLAVAGLLALELSGVAEGTEIAEADADAVLASIGTIVLFATIVGYGQMTLMGVAEEKASRVVEVLLGSVQPTQLLAGKVIGIGLFAIGQMAAILSTIAVTIALLDTVPIPAATWTTLVTVLGFFLFGFAFYSTVYAAFGALMGEAENASNAAGPLNLFVAVGYMTAMISASSGENLFARILSLLPPFTPIVMPMRIVQGHAGVWEVVLAVAVLGLAIYGVTRLAGRIYIGGVIRGGKASLRQAWRAAAL